MARRTLPDFNRSDWPIEASDLQQSDFQQAQEEIYQFLKKLVNHSSAETVLQEFKQLFITGDSTVNPQALQAVYKIIFQNDEEEFKNTLKRSCYILINNWASQRKYQYIQDLIQVLGEAKEAHTPLSHSLKRLRAWIINFVDSEDYQQLKLFASPYKSHWSHRYTSYLLVPQYLDASNPKEQREIAKNLSKRLKEKYKLDLAMYTARCNSPTLKENELSNPTRLGDEVIRIIKRVISRTTIFDYTNQAHLFIQQTRELNYVEFKHKLKNYLCFYADKSFLEAFQNRLSEKLDNLYKNYHEDSLNVDLLLRTCRQIIGWLTIEEDDEPSYLFILLTTQGNTLTLVIILLKIVLICQYVRTHLEVCLAKLIRYYENYPEKDCQWVINFLEIFNVVFAIYTENVQYNLVKVKNHQSEGENTGDLDAYRVFSQLKGADLRGNKINSTDLRGSDLSAADLREANLCKTDMSQADLSLAKLSRANLNHAILNEAELIAADLNGADLSNACLILAQLRHADLRQANLQGAILNRATLNAVNASGANFQDADLQYADLSQANLTQVNLSGANLQYANLSNANLKGANLRGANLQFANLNSVNLQDSHLSQALLNRADLENANLAGADLQSALMRHAKLNYAKLRSANLSRTDLSHAELSYGDLSYANLREALLRHVHLNHTDLNKADLREANLYSSNLSCALNVEKAQFGGNSELFEITPD
jgi:uncharacterized protein YjbI with pentapeptide repeats